jgi:cell division protein FtsZ
MVPGQLLKHGRQVLNQTEEVGMFELVDMQPQEAVIKVIGVGGCGGNAVDHMIEAGVQGVEFIVANTDSQALKRNKAPVQLQLGCNVTKGLGAGANPEIGRQAAMEDRERIIELIEGADMLFLTAGMGGGTGTGAAPIEGLEALTKHVDSLIVIPNEKLMQVLGDDISMLDAFKAANGVLHGAVAGIAEVINCPGLVNVDFADVRTVMSEMGMAMMGSSSASGPHRSTQAAEQAVASPLLEDVNLAGARGVLVNITASASLKMKEVHDVMSTIKAFTAEDATVIVGTVIDEAMSDRLRVTMVATGLGSPISRNQSKPLTVVKTGTDAGPVEVVDYAQLDTPAVIRRRNRESTIEAMRQSGVDLLDIPAFLRKQAD